MLLLVGAVLSMMLVRALSLLTLKNYNGPALMYRSKMIFSYGCPSLFSSSNTAQDSTLHMSSTKSNTEIIPRAAVSVVVRLEIPSNMLLAIDQAQIYYALVQRGKEPNKGIWSFPGGKVELGESSIHAAKRELWEETKLSENESDPTNLWKLRFFHDGPVTSTDSIIRKDDSSVAFHYVITQWFAETILDCMNNSQLKSTTDPSLLLPNLVASDDAADAKWFTLDEIQQGILTGLITKGVEKVINRSELLYQNGLLDTTI